MIKKKTNTQQNKIKDCDLHTGKRIGRGLYGIIYESDKKNIIIKATKETNEFKYAKKAGEIGIGPKVFKTIKRCGYNLIYMEKINIMLYEWLCKKHTKKIYRQTYDKLVKLIDTIHENNMVHGDIHIGNIGMIRNKWVLIDYGKTHNYKNKNKPYIDFIRKISYRPFYSNIGYEKYFKKILVPYNKLPLSTKIHIYILKKVIKKSDNN